MYRMKERIRSILGYRIEKGASQRSTQIPITWSNDLELPQSQAFRRIYRTPPTCESDRLMPIHHPNRDNRTDYN
jgi:hypothetical protein